MKTEKAKALKTFLRVVFFFPHKVSSQCCEKVELQTATAFCFQNSSKYYAIKTRARHCTKSFPFLVSLNPWDNIFCPHFIDENTGLRKLEFFQAQKVIR